MAWDKIKEGLKDVTEKGIELAGDQLEKTKAQAEEVKELKKNRQQELKERVAQMDREGIAYCPKCYSTSLAGNKRGWKLMTGFIGSSKIITTCLKCGNKFKPGKR